MEVSTGNYKGYSYTCIMSPSFLQIKFYPTIYVKLYVSRMISIEYCIEYQMILS